jgi:hypothetical protein
METAVKIVTALEEVLGAVPGLVDSKHIDILHQVKNILALALELKAGK